MGPFSCYETLNLYNFSVCIQLQLSGININTSIYTFTIIVQIHHHFYNNSFKPQIIKPLHKEFPCSHMYPSDSRYPDNLANMDSMGPSMYNNQMRPSSMDMSSGRPPYYDTPYYDKNTPIMQPPIYDYMNQPPMMPMNQGIVDPRYPNWRDSSQNRNPIMPSYYDTRPNETYMHPKGSMSSTLPNTMPPMSYPEIYPTSHNLINENIRPSQMNLLQRISYLIKPQLPELQKIMLKAANSSVSFKKKQTSKRQRSHERQRHRQRSRSQEKKKSSNSTGEWVCIKCSFLNFEFRDKCKKCNESKPVLSSVASGSGGGRNFIPGPEDWKCNKCGNLNYARRHECNRCKAPKNTNK